MSIITNNFGMYNGSILPILHSFTRRGKPFSTENATAEIKALQKKLVDRYNLTTTDDVTERDLIYFLYLNPTGYIDESEYSKRIMQSSIADQYFKIGIITKGAGDEMKSQYRLTAFGRSQIKNAVELEMLK